MKLLRHIRGLTLIEMLIVIALLGILTAALLFQIIPQIQKGRDSRRKMDLYTIKNAIEQYYDTHNCFPVWLPACSSPMKIGEEVILPAIPCDPKTHTTYRYVTDETACSDRFELYTTLERGSDQDIDRLSCTSGCGPGCIYNYGVSSSNRSLEHCAVLYVCAPGGGKDGICEAFDDPVRSQCPKVYENNPTCQGKCSVPANRCKNSSGKQVPDK